MDSQTVEGLQNQNQTLQIQPQDNPPQQNIINNPTPQNIPSSHNSHIPTPKNQIPEIKEAIIGNENENNPIYQYQLQIPKGNNRDKKKSSPYY